MLAQGVATGWSGSGGGVVERLHMAEGKINIDKLQEIKYALHMDMDSHMESVEHGEDGAHF